MSKSAFIYLIFFGLCTPALSQTRNIVGRILSNEDQKPIKNANIVIEGSEKSAISNHLGFFELEIVGEDVGSLIISHIGYATSKVEIPEIDNFKILLNREYIHIAEFDLAYYEERDLELADDPTDSLATASEISARYPGGWEHFFNDLGRALLKTSFWKELPDDSVLKVSYTVDHLGMMSEFTFDPYLNNLDFVETQFKSLKNWSPAKQNGNLTSQFFELSLKWSQVYTTVEKSAMPEGGMTAFYKFIGANLKYPKRSKNMGIEGRVFVEFIVEKDSSLTELKISQGVSSDLDEEAMRVISLSKWVPGTRQGKPVRQRVVLPISFKLSKFKWDG